MLPLCEGADWSHLGFVLCWQAALTFNVKYSSHWTLYPPSAQIISWHSTVVTGQCGRGDTQGSRRCLSLFSASFSYRKLKPGVVIAHLVFASCVGAFFVCSYLLKFAVSACRMNGIVQPSCSTLRNIFWYFRNMSRLHKWVKVTSLKDNWIFYHEQNIQSSIHSFKYTHWGIPAPFQASCWITEKEKRQIPMVTDCSKVTFWWETEIHFCFPSLKRRYSKSLWNGIFWLAWQERYLGVGKNWNRKIQSFFPLNYARIEKSSWLSSGLYCLRKYVNSGAYMN